VSKQETTVSTDAKALASIRGALDELGGDLAKLNETAFSDGVSAYDTVCDRVAPIMAEARKTWVNMEKGRVASGFTGAKFIEWATAKDDAWKVYAAGTAGREAMIRLYNFATYHSPKTEQVYKAMVMFGFDLGKYCDWLPEAYKYGTNGKLTSTHQQAKDAADKRREAEATASAATTMFATKVETYISDATTPTERMTELDALIHDAKALREAIAKQATLAERTAAAKAFKARVTDRTAKQVAKLLAK
jgi:hypothetical protein